MAEAPPGAEACGPPGVAVVAGDQGGDGDEVVGIGRVAEAQGKGDRERHEQRSAREQAGEPGVDVLEGAEQEVEVHTQSSQRPTRG